MGPNKLVMKIHLILCVIRLLHVVVGTSNELNDVLEGAALLLVVSATSERTDTLEEGTANGLEDAEQAGAGLIVVLGGTSEKLVHSVVVTALLLLVVAAKRSGRQKRIAKRL